MTRMISSEQQNAFRAVAGDPVACVGFRCQSLPQGGIDLDDLRDVSPALADLVEIFGTSVLVDSNRNLTSMNNIVGEPKTLENDGWAPFVSNDNFELHG